MTKQASRQGKQDLHIYLDLDLFERFKAKRKAMQPPPTQNALVAWLIATWLAEGESHDQR